MCKPIPANEIKLYNICQSVVCELANATSCLHSPPDPIPEEDRKKDAWYLSETDDMVRHAVEHTHNAMEYVRRAECLLDNINEIFWDIERAIIKQDLEAVMDLVHQYRYLTGDRWPEEKRQLLTW